MSKSLRPPEGSLTIEGKATGEVAPRKSQSLLLNAWLVPWGLSCYHMCSATPPLLCDPLSLWGPSTTGHDDKRILLRDSKRPG